MEQSSTPPTELLSALLSNPALLGTLTSLLSSLGATRPSTEEATSKSETAQASPSPLPLDGIAQMLSGLMRSTKEPPSNDSTGDSISSSEDIVPASEESVPTSGKPLAASEETASAASSTLSGQREDIHHKSREALRNDLLIALKPFLSKERCAAVDTIIRLSALGKVLGQIH